MKPEQAIEIIKEVEWGMPATDRNELECRWKLMKPAKEAAIKALEMQEMQQECIAELFMLVENITERAVKRDLSWFRCSGAGGCDMYQGMPPICRKRDDILHRYEDIVYEAVKTKN